MLDYKQIIDSSKAFEFVKQDLESDKISHAYLFLNVDENYLMKFCESVSKLFINSTARPEDCEKNSLRIDSHNHPDVMVYGETETVNSEMMSTIIEQASYKPFESDKKIFVLANFQDVSEICQNKILKTIEEPPENTYFLITAKTKSRILQTILSRVKEIELDIPTAKQIEQLLYQIGVSKSDAEIYANCCAGDISLAERLAADEKFIDFFNQVLMCLFEVNGSRDVLKWSSEFSSKLVDKIELFEIFYLLLRDVMLIKSGAEDLISNVNIKSKLKLIGASLDLKAISDLMREITGAKEKLQFNVNQTAIVDEFLFKLAEVKVKCRRLSV